MGTCSPSAPKVEAITPEIEFTENATEVRAQFEEIIANNYGAAREIPNVVVKTKLGEVLGRNVSLLMPAVDPKAVEFRHVAQGQCDGLQRKNGRQQPLRK